MFVKWIKGCICDPSFAVLVNGTPTEWFKSSKGLRQGDPLSPYLFILGTEFLIRSIKSLQRAGKLTGRKYGTEGEELNQLWFADDCLLVTKAEVHASQGAQQGHSEIHQGQWTKH